MQAESSGTSGAPSDEIERRRFRRVSTIGFLAGAAFLWLAFGRLDREGVQRALLGARVWPWIPLAVLSYLTGQVVRGMRCRRLVRPDTDLPLATATNIVVAGYAANNLLPARLGEAVRAGLLCERAGLPFAQSVTVTLVERTLDGWAILLCFAAAGAALPQASAGIVDAARVAAILFGAATLSLLVLLLTPYGVARRVAGAAGAVRASWQEPVWRTVVAMGSALASLRRPGDAARLGLLSMLVWLCEAGMFLAVLPALHLPARPGWALSTMAAVNLGILFPSTPGYIGPFHYFCAATLGALGVASAVAASYAIAVHAVFYLPITLWGIGVGVRYGLELGWTISVARSARWRAAPTSTRDASFLVLGSGSVAARERPAGRLLRAIVEALLPDEASTRRGPSTDEVADFVQGQLDALPPALRALQQGALAGFQLLVWLRHGRGFLALPPARRRRLVHAWCFGPIALARQSLRVVRSTALLAYYDLPAGAAVAQEERVA